MSISLHQFAPINGGLLLQAHWGCVAQKWRNIYEVSGVLVMIHGKVNIKKQKQNLFHSQAGNTSQQLSVSERKHKYSALSPPAQSVYDKTRCRARWIYECEQIESKSFVKKREWGSKPACSLVLSNRSIRRSALLRSSLRSASSWLIRPWEERESIKKLSNHHQVNMYCMTLSCLHTKDMMNLSLEAMVRKLTQKRVMYSNIWRKLWKKMQ